MVELRGFGSNGVTPVSAKSCGKKEEIFTPM
jgi:hypothetical protein